MDRRSLITGLVSFVAAPAIVRAASLMPISGDVYEFWEYRVPLLPSFDMPERDSYIGPNGHPYEGIWTFLGKRGRHSIWSDRQISFEKREYLD